MVSPLDSGDFLPSSFSNMIVGAYLVDFSHSEAFCGDSGKIVTTENTFHAASLLIHIGTIGSFVSSGKIGQNKTLNNFKNRPN